MVNDITHAIGLAKGKVAGEDISIDTIDQQRESQRNFTIDLAHKWQSNLIWSEVVVEIPGITFPQTKEILEGKSIPGGIDIDKAVVVRNMKRVWDAFFRDPYKDLQNLESLRNVHSIVDSSYHGYSFNNLRTGQVYITGTKWLPKTPVLKNDVETIFNELQNEKPLERAVKTFCKISKLQPFGDGNKRTAQILSNSLMINAGIGFWGIGTSEQEVEHFGKVLVKYYETDDDTEISELIKSKIIIADMENPPMPEQI